MTRYTGADNHCSDGRIVGHVYTRVKEPEKWARIKNMIAAAMSLFPIIGYSSDRSVGILSLHAAAALPDNRSTPCMECENLNNIRNLCGQSGIYALLIRLSGGQGMYGVCVCVHLGIWDFGGMLIELYWVTYTHTYTPKWKAHTPPERIMESSAEKKFTLM